jgi:hypothetical protein
MAALDLGTNNCRLLVAEPRGDGFRVVDSFSRIVRLGEGLAATDRLSEAAMERTLAALKVCRQVMDRHRVTHARCVATEACRRAVNGPGSSAGCATWSGSSWNCCTTMTRRGWRCWAACRWWSPTLTSC